MYAYSAGHIQLNLINATNCIQPSATMYLQPSEMMEFNAQTMVFLSAPLLTREDDGEEEKMMNCLSIQREGKLWTYI
jgi:hypothetical protein